MKKLPLIVLATAMLSTAAAQSVDYDTYFTNRSLRIDLVLAGNSKTQSIYYRGAHIETEFAGSHKTLIDPFNYGNYMLKVETTGGKTIFTRGFCTLFNEWRTEPESTRLDRAYNNSISMPMPKDSVRVTILGRVWESGEFGELLRFAIDPNDVLLTQGKENEFEVVTLIDNGLAADKVDLVFVAEGYTADEMDKFEADARRLTERLFENEPYNKHIGDFNVYAVKAVSQESGVDFPHLGTWVDSALDSHFYTFRSDRYLTCPDHTALCKAASNVPYDALFVIANTEVYGGGGIYNSYAIGSADNKLTESVFVHELGHSLAGLGDEYYTSSTSYVDFYNLKVEPWEPNITTLVDFDRKWKSMIDPATPIPTPNEETEKQIVGLYQGGGYVAEGIYRPVWNCRMKSNSAGFCPVCAKAIEAMIGYYTDK